MRRPSCLIVLFVVCATLRSCMAVRFLTLEELLRYHEQQQNPESEEQQDLELPNQNDKFMFNNTTQQPPIGQTHHHQQPYVDEDIFAGQQDGSGHEETTTATTAAETTTTTFETGAPTTTRRMTRCCHLGERAGRKGDHCNPDSYMPKNHRNRNRGHNYKQTNTHPSQEKTQLDKCTSGVFRRHAEEFRTCCEEAYKRMWQSERGEDPEDSGITHLLEVPI